MSVQDSPMVGTCIICGHFPAHDLRLQHITAWVIGYTKHKVEGTFCRTCGRYMYNEAQAKNLTRGWWGVFGPMIMLFFAVPSNFFNYQSHKAVKEPQGRSQAANTPLAFPLPKNRSALQRPSVLTVFAAFLGIIILGVVTPGSTASTDPYAVVGTCLANPTGTSLVVVECSDSSASYEITSTTSNPDLCPSYQVGASEGRYVRNDSGKYACLVTH